jgi:hypothetical protein
MNERIPAAFVMYVSRDANGLWHVSFHDKTNVLDGLQVATTSLAEALAESARQIVKMSAAA